MFGLHVALKYQMVKAFTLSCQKGDIILCSFKCSWIKVKKNAQIGIKNKGIVLYGAVYYQFYRNE